MDTLKRNSINVVINNCVCGSCDVEIKEFFMK